MIKSQKAKEGYLLIDHRVSPGNNLIPSGAVYESATITCSHCGSLVVLNPNRSKPRNYCSKCDHYICDGCAIVDECRPLMKLFDEVEKNGKLISNL